jgi:hypothetical protein
LGISPKDLSESGDIFARGKRGVVLIENQGAFDSGNVLKWAVNLHFPLVLFTGNLGYSGYQNPENTPPGKMKKGEGEITGAFKLFIYWFNFPI